MTFFDFFLIAWISLGALITVGMIGKPRPTTTPKTAVIVLVIDVLLILGLLWSRGVIA